MISNGYIVYVELMWALLHKSRLHKPITWPTAPF